MSKKGNIGKPSQPELPGLVSPGALKDRRTGVPKRTRVLAMSVPDVTRHLAYLKEHGDRVLSNDIKKFEIRPEIKNQNAREIAEGRKFSPTEWNSWRTTVRFKIDLIRQRTGQPIREGSDEEQEVFQAVAKFRSLIPEDRLRILDSNKLLARHVMIDLRKYRPSE